MRVGIYQQRAATGDPRAMMPADMLRMHTLGSAEVLGIDAQVGSLEPGKFADFAILEEDPYEVDTARLKDIPVWGTALSGRLQPA